MATKYRSTFSVFLPLEKEAKFPDRCVACGAASAEKKIEASAQTNGLLQFVPLVSRRNRTVKVEAPACVKCAKSSWWSTGLREVAVILLVVGLVGLLAFAAQSFDFSAKIAKYVPRMIAKRVGILLALVIGAPLIYWIYYRLPPVPFEIEVADEKVEYIFRDRQYRRDFEKMNSEF